MLQEGEVGVEGDAEDHGSAIERDRKDVVDNVGG